MKKAVPYYRVSTKDQGLDGLGIEAQQKVVREFIRVNEFEILKEFSEVESGRNNKRRAIKEALQKCEKEKATLIVATLDRLSRNLAFISALIETKAKFTIVDAPLADKFVLHILGAVAQFLAEQISKNTKAALAAAKARGVQLGVHGKNVLSKQNKQAADDFALKMGPIIQRYCERGIKTVRKICKELNRRKVATYTGSSKWYPTTVHNLLKRIALLKPIANEHHL